jgi:hypothetical protein
MADFVGPAQLSYEPILCPGRRLVTDPQSSTYPQADYGYGDPSEQWPGHYSVFSSPTPVTLREINHCRGTSMTLLLGVIGMRPKYGEHDGPWPTNGAVYRRSAFTFAHDSDDREMWKFMGGPFKNCTIALLCDRSVGSLRFDSFAENDPRLGLAWTWIVPEAMAETLPE